MKSLFAVLLTACLCMSVKGEDSKPPRTLPGGWVYVWGDEFNGSRIDAKKWKPELGVIRNQGSQQTYTGRPKNMRLEDGCLVLETHFEKFANINYKKSSADWIKNTKFMPYTSGSVTTIKTKNFMFGRLEVRAKVPKTKGIWPDRETAKLAVEWSKTGNELILLLLVGLYIVNTIRGTIILGRGYIESSDGLNLTNPETIPSSPIEDINMLRGIQQDIKSPPPYNILKNNCADWSYRAIWYGRDKTVH